MGRKSAIALFVLLLCLGCSRGGLSRPFRSAAKDALTELRAAGQARSTQAVEQADAAIANARGKANTNADLKTADVLDWYSILVHRHDLQRTENWRKLCDTEAELYLTGRNTSSTELRNGSRYETVSVTRGACEQAVFEMMKQDCERFVSTRSVRPSDCVLLQGPADSAR